MRLIFLLVLAVLFSAGASAETLLDLRLEPNTLCNGDSTLLFIDIDNTGTVAIRDASLQISSSSLALSVTERIDVPLGRTTRVMQFSVSHDARGDYALVVSLDGESRSEILHVLSCSFPMGVPVLIVPESNDERSTNYPLVAVIVGIQLIIALTVVSVVSVMKRKRASSQPAPVKRKKSKSK